MKVIFPLTVVGISFLLLLAQSLLRKVKSKRSQGYEPIQNGSYINGNSQNGHAHASILTNGDVSGSDDDDEGITIGGGRLQLGKSTTHGSVAAIDNPTGQYTLLVVELFAIATVLAINIAALILGAYGPNGTLAEHAGVITWAYVLLLAS